MSIRPSSLGTLLTILSLGSLKFPNGELSRFTYSEYLMGVDTRIVVYAESETAAQDACRAAFDRIAQLDSIMSDYRKDSELVRLSTSAVGHAVKVSDDLFRVLAVAQEFSARSGGMFDVTVGPTVQLWRTARKTGVLPSTEAIRDATRHVGWKKLRLDPVEHTVSLAMPGMRLDLGAIGKGYATDEAQAVLRKHGISRALIEMGGNIFVTDPPPGKEGWEIDAPNAGKRLVLSDCAIATSGDTEQFVVVGGRHFSHVIDPHTGWALTNRVQATVICRTGLIGDPLAISMTLLDARGRKRVLDAYPGSKIYVKREPID